MPTPDEPPQTGLRLDRRHPVARRVIAQWRCLIDASEGDPAAEPTLIGCSAGADSTALSLALASTGARVTLAFARHGARPVADVDRDQRAGEVLAQAIGAEFVALDCVLADAESTTEADMRRHRYEALATEARQRGIRFVATGHHADDQLETVLLALLRGAGPQGMAGVPPIRPLDAREPHVFLIRPMLEIPRSEIEQLCTDFGVNPPGEGKLTWVEDETNTDRRYTRNRIRHEIAPLLKQMQPGVAARVSRSAELFRQVAMILRERVISFDMAQGSGVSDSERAWPRDAMRHLQPIEVGELLRWTVEERFDRRGLDRLNSHSLLKIGAAVHDSSTEPRRFEFGDGLLVRVHANDVTLERKSPD